jgi:site-specific recombinase XerD
MALVTAALVPRSALPALVERAGNQAVFAAEEFFHARLRNPHTRAAYTHAVARFLAHCASLGLELHQITPRHVAEYFDRHPGAIATRKQHLAALRHFFDLQVQRHAIMLNPAASVRGERYRVVEGKTPEITAEQAARLLAGIDTATLAGLRDRALIGTLAYTAARVGAVAALRCGDLHSDGHGVTLRFLEKGGKSREIPARRDLERMLGDYMAAAGLAGETASSPLFRAIAGRSRSLTRRPMSVHDACRMVKRRLAQAGLPPRLSAHSFRVAAITSLLDQGVPLEQVQRLAGHADPRTTRLYDRRELKVTRALVEQIAI